MKYNVGYTQGAFDMFHIGHLNLIRRAKEQCDYLIVAVNTDDLILRYKNKNTVVPFEERAQIIAALKYVDEGIAADTLDKEEILASVSGEKNAQCGFTMSPSKNFDCIFIGDDWKGNPRWASTEQIMKQYDVDVVYLPHTEGTTSTLLREKLTNI